MNILDAIQEALVPKPTSVMDPNYKEPTQGEMFRNGIARQLMSYLTFPADMLIESRNILNKDDRMPTLAERGAKSLGLTAPRPFTTDQAAMDAGAALTDVAPMGLMMTGPSKGAIGLKNEVGAINPKRMSAQEAINLGYWHDIGAGKKLPIPIGDMKVEREVVKDLPPKKMITPEQLQGGAIIPLPGDRSIAGQNLLGIDGVRFNNPVYLEGGHDFMRTHQGTGGVWASEQGAAQAIQNQVNKAAEHGGPVHGVFAAMGPESMNYNVMMSDALLEQIQAGKFTKKSIAEFDKEVRSIRPEWKGLMSPEARGQLESNGALRHVFVDRMDLKKFQDAGFPNIAYTRYAITDPALLNEPMYASGLAIGKMSPFEELMLNPANPHKTYNAQLRGNYAGGFESSVPKEVLFPDWYKARRDAGIPVGGDVRSFQLSKPTQKTNQEWLDGVMRHLEAQASR